MINELAGPAEGLMLLIDKPKDYTSAKVVNIIKRKLNVKKAGHSGTLDPKATGLLVVCTSKKTKELNTLLDAEKEYTGTMILGESTPSFDSETVVNKTRTLENVNDDIILQTVSGFLGEIDQIPPMFSAVKYKGKPLYKYARKNKEIERKSRKVIIKEFQICRINLPLVEFRVLCSKGTYIRTLVNDFGEKLGTGAYLKELRRTKIGSYDIKDSVTLEKFLEMNYEKSDDQNY